VTDHQQALCAAILSLCSFWLGWAASSTQGRPAVDTQRYEADLYISYLQGREEGRVAGAAWAMSVCGRHENEREDH